MNGKVMNVLMPCAGLYKRFPDDVPKYLRVLSDMRPMFSWALDSVRNYPGGVKLYFAIRKENDDIWDAASVIKQFENNAEVMILDHQTNGPACTVYEMIKHFRIDGRFIIKDCDCYFNSNGVWPINSAVYLGWRESAVGDRGNKSWVEVKDGFVASICEKEKPLDWYCHGGYQFESAIEFINVFDRINDTKEIFCSNIIDKMLKMGVKFQAISCQDLYDWGTWEKYVSWRQKRKSYFIDIDGTITNAGGPFGKNNWKNVKVISGVKEKIQSLKNDGCAIYIVTSRPELESESTEEILKNGGIVWDKIIYGIQNGPRIMINDYANSNPYPSVEAVNTERNSGSWIEMI